jgi:hypothetical protein
MHVILQTWCQIQLTSSSFRYVNSDPGHIQCIYSSAFSVLQYSTERICAAIGDNRTLRCPLYCKFGAKYRAHHPVYPMWTVVPDIYYVITARIFSLQYSSVGNCAAIVDINTIQCALYCNLGAKYSASPSSLHNVYCGP